MDKANIKLPHVQRFNTGNLASNTAPAGKVVGANTTINNWNKKFYSI
ncbi:MAG TPA: hypothetical protein LFW11_06640 [Rickettsia endosymbiont of Proechinophthirus fluctus]|nr:hypothetical protein [Rickettsia endosymbiont of Proechinophthirus fluctus]HJD54980.1 hypothetical protein [Rickettsia endosymbiont of Proechinophthirus fluctus]